MGLNQSTVTVENQLTHTGRTHWLQYTVCRHKETHIEHNIELSIIAEEMRNTLLSQMSHCGPHLFKCPMRYLRVSLCDGGSRDRASRNASSFFSGSVTSEKQTGAVIRYTVWPHRIWSEINVRIIYDVIQAGPGEDVWGGRATCMVFSTVENLMFYM